LSQKIGSLLGGKFLLRQGVFYSAAFCRFFMPKTKEQKQEIIKDLKEKITKQKAVVLVDFGGSNAKKIFQLRDELKKEDCLLQVVKKTLLKKALQQGHSAELSRSLQDKFLEKAKETDLLEKIKNIKGQMALAFGFADELMPAKITFEASQKNDNLKILAGILGKEFLDKERILELAKLPAKPELLARLLGSIQAPVSNFVYVLNGNIKGLVCALDAIAKNKQ